MRITDYQILCAKNSESLQVAVKQFIKEGWQPFGSLTVNGTVGNNYSSPSGLDGVYQTMVRYEN